MKNYIVLTLKAGRGSVNSPTFNKTVMKAKTRAEVVEAFAGVEGILDIYTLDNIQ